MSFRQYRDAEMALRAEVARGAQQPAPASASVSAPIPKPALAPLTVKLERDRLVLFERIAARENRPVKSVIAECLNGCAVQVARIEAQNIRLAAAASDERERRGWDEDAEFAHRSAGAGYVEVCLALD